MDADEILAGPAIEAAVAALAERNRHHLEQMEPGEQQDAVGHWRELAITVLTAARAAADDPSAPAAAAAEGEVRGRATIVLEDVGDSEVTVHAAFWPEMQDLGGGEVAATPAQIAALELLEQLTGGDELQD
jgi:hypothetical protein